MKKSKHLQTKVFSLFATMLMVFSLIGPVIANAESTNDSSISKISDKLLKTYESEDNATFIVTFKEKANTAKVAEKVKEQTKASLSAEQTELAQRKAVINALEATATSTQKSVVEFLKEKNLDPKSFNVTNAVAVTANEEIAKEIAAFEEVESILPNFKITNPVDEPGEQDGPKLTSKALKNVIMVHAPEVWEQDIDGSGIVIASMDSGVQWDHEAVKNNYRGYNAKNDSVTHKGNFFDAVNRKSEAYDDHGHGTHTVGTMVGYKKDEDAYLGVAPGAQWIAAKILDENNSGKTLDVLRAAEWILAPGGDPAKAPDIVNNSWGFAGVTAEESDEFFRDVLKSWRSAGILPVFAAGNEIPGVVSPVEGSVSLPGLYPEAFTVGAVDSNKNLAEFSLRGPSEYGEIKPEVVAPGVEIFSSIPTDAYGVASGTSMAAPAVAGVAALMLDANPDATLNELEKAMTSSAEALKDEQYTKSPNNGYGHGLVNAEAAVEIVKPEPEPDPDPEPVTIDRINGDNRYETAIEISQNGWEDGSLNEGAVVIARGDDFADALAGVPLAKAMHSPILLVNKHHVDAVAKEIKRLGATGVYVLGGKDAISEETLNKLTTAAKASLKSENVTRLAGDGRYGTAAAIAEELKGYEGYGEKAVVAYGMNFADALSVASYAAQAKMPILLTKKDNIPEATKPALEGVKETIVVGGPTVVSKAVVSALPNVTRLAGDNRYETNFAIMDHFGVKAEHGYVATGTGFPDALSGAVLAAKNKSSVVLVKPTVVKQVNAQLNDAGVKDLTIFGGTVAVDDSVKNKLEKALNK